MIICYTVPETRRVMDVIFKQQQQQQQKTTEKPLEISSFYTCVPKITIT